MIFDNNNLFLKESSKIFSLFIFISFLQLVSYGIPVWEYLNYNIDWYYNLKYSHFYETDEFINVLNINNNTLIWYFTIYLKPLLQIPLIFIFLSILTKAVIFYFTYLIIDNFVYNKKISIGLSILFLLSTGDGSHGPISNGMFASPVFFRGSISATASLIGIFLTLKNKPLKASFFFTLSIQLHPMYGATCVSFFLPGVFLSAFFKKENIYSFLIVLFFIILNLIFILITNNNSISQDDIIINNWYKFASLSNPDDLLITWTIWNSGFWQITLLLIATYFCLMNPKKLINYYFYGSLVIYIICLTLEFIHNQNLFFGKASEYMIGIQFRRGIWVLMLFAIIIIIENLSLYSKRKSFDKNLIFTFVIFLIIYLNPTVQVTLYGSFVIFLSLFFSNYRKNYSLAPLILFAFCIYYLLENLSTNSILEYKIYEKLNFNIEDYIKYLIYFLLSSILAISLIYIFKKYKIYHCIYLVIFTFLIIYTSNGIIKNKLIDDLNLISNNGILNYPNSDEIALETYNNDVFDIDYEMIKSIRTHNKKNELILLPFKLLNFNAPNLYQANSFINYYDISYSTLSINHYASFRNKLSIVYGKNEIKEFLDNDFIINYKTSDGMLNTFRKKLDKYYNKMSVQHIKNLSHKYGVKYIVTEKVYSDLKLIYIGEKYNVYNIGAIKN